jgi:CubicO group peptidase (beta-lactamase class C family)
MLIEKASGKTYQQFLTERIFQPLGMTATRLVDRSVITPKRASGYAWKDGVLVHAIYTGTAWAYSEGGLFSTVLDLAKWAAALDEGKLLKRSILEQMWTATRLNDGTTAYYGLGWNTGNDTARKQVYHSGSKEGFLALIRHYTTERLTVALLSNIGHNVNTGGITSQVAAIYAPPNHVEKKQR